MELEIQECEDIFTSGPQTRSLRPLKQSLSFDLIFKKNNIKRFKIPSKYSTPTNTLLSKVRLGCFE
jgi:hypothetical protein